MSLNDILIAFRGSLTECEDFISLAHERNRSRRYKLSRDRREFVVESAFMKFFISWETFLERAFHAYLTREPSISGTVINCYFNPIDLSHAKKALIGTQKYVDWSNPDIVRRLSDIYFGRGNIIGNQISSIQTDVFDLKTIRNAAAHMSSTTSSQLSSLHTRLLGSSGITVTVYNTIMANDPTSSAGTSPTITIFQKYKALLDLAAENIANG